MLTNYILNEIDTTKKKKKKKKRKLNSKTMEIKFVIVHHKITTDCLKL